MKTRKPEIQKKNWESLSVKKNQMEIRELKNIVTERKTCWTGTEAEER